MVMTALRSKLAVLTAALFVGGAAAYAAADGISKANWKDAKQVALGKQVYVDHCAACHGVNLEGQPNWRERKPDGKLPAPPHDASGHTWHHSDAQLFDMTKRGTAALAGPGYQTDMREFGSLLSDAEIWSVLAYIKSTWPPEIRDRHDRVNMPHRK